MARSFGRTDEPSYSCELQPAGVLGPSRTSSTPTNPVSETDAISGWACFYEEAHVAELETVGRREGSPAPWVFFLPPKVTAITFADRLWEGVNAELGTLLDRAEEESLPPELAARVAAKIEQFAREQYSVGLVTREAAWLPDGRALLVTVEASALRSLLTGLATFLQAAAAQGGTVMASL